jgi:hypothetical protein
VQFSAFEEHVKLVERAKQLLAREAPRVGLAELHLQAMRLFVAALEKKKLGARPKRQRRPEKMKKEAEPAQAAPTTGAREVALASPKEGPPKRSRYVPMAVRRTVVERDAARCTYVDESGRRCRETSFAELHHLVPFASGGENVAENLTLRCTAHNALAAEEDFGREQIRQARDRAKHESLRRQHE